jgi:hypothetical protein
MCYVKDASEVGGRVAIAWIGAGQLPAFIVMPPPSQAGRTLAGAVLRVVARVNESPGHERGQFAQPGGVGVGVGVAVGVGVGVGDGPPQMIDERTKKSPASAPLA